MSKANAKKATSVPKSSNPGGKVVTKKEGKVTKKEETKVKVSLPKVDHTVKYESTGKYSPKAQHNIVSMAEVENALPATVAELALVIPKHTNFIGYLIRREGLQPVS